MAKEIINDYFGGDIAEARATIDGHMACEFTTEEQFNTLKVIANTTRFTKAEKEGVEDTDNCTYRMGRKVELTPFGKLWIVQDRLDYVFEQILVKMEEEIKLREEVEAMRVAEAEGTVLTSKDTVGNSNYSNYEGEVVVLSAWTLKPQYRSKENQLWYATSGFGCNPSASGNAVFCFSLEDGESTRWERYDILGIYGGELTEKQKQILKEKGKL